MTTNCNYCKKDFDAKTVRAKFCSDTCKVLFNRKKSIIAPIVETIEEQIEEVITPEHELKSEPQEIKEEKSIEIQDIAHVLLKDGMKRQLNKDTVMLLYELYFPNTGKTEVRTAVITSEPEKKPQIASDYEKYLSIIEKSMDGREIRKILDSLNDPNVIGYDDYHKLSRIGEQRIKALIANLKQAYIQELWDNEENKEAIMEILTRIKADMNLTRIEKQLLTSNEVFRK